MKPLGLRITSGRLYSTRLLQLNLSMALQRTLNHIAFVQQKHRLGSADRSDHLESDEKEYTVQDRASGVGGEFVIVERRSDRQRRRSSTGGASGMGGASAAEEGGGPSRRGSVEAGPSAPTRRASGHRRERVNSDAMFSAEEEAARDGHFPMAHFRREQVWVRVRCRLTLTLTGAGSP